MGLAIGFVPVPYTYLPLSELHTISHDTITLINRGTPPLIFTYLWWVRPHPTKVHVWNCRENIGWHVISSHMHAQFRIVWSAVEVRNSMVRCVGLMIVKQSDASYYWAKHMKLLCSKSIRLANISDAATDWFSVQVGNLYTLERGKPEVVSKDHALINVKGFLTTSGHAAPQTPTLNFW